MKKFLLLTALFGAALTAAAQWPTNMDESPVLITPSGITDYGNYQATSPDGTVYTMQIVPRNFDEAGRTALRYILSICGPDGVMKTATDQGAEGAIEVCYTPNRSWTVVSDPLHIDRDGNPIIIVEDCRNSAEDSKDLSFTVYKFDKDGNKIWEHDLNEGMTVEEAASCDMAQTTDGGYVFCYCVYDYQTQLQHIELEKLDKDGNTLWHKVMKDSKSAYNWPILVETDNNDAILAYTFGTSMYVYTARIDENGNEKWSTRIYRGGFDTTPLWTHFHAIPDGKGGVLVNWRDDREYDGWWKNYVNHVDAEGNIAYPNEMDAVRVAYLEDGISIAGASIAHNDQEGTSFVAYRFYAQKSQDYEGLGVQKIADNGELLWDAEGINVEDLSFDLEVANVQVQCAEDGGCVVFYQLGEGNNVTGPKENRAAKYNKDGVREWNIKLDNWDTYKVSLLSTPLIDGQYWIVSWEDRLDGPSDMGNCYDRYAIRLYTNGERQPAPEAIAHTSLDKGNGAVQYFNAAGQRIAAPAQGVNIIKTSDGVRKVVR